jgi:anti-anti-sigma factor
MIRSDLHDESTDGIATVVVHRTGSTLVATLCGELDAVSAPHISQSVLDQLDPTVDELRLELGDLAFCDSSGLKLIFRLDRALAERGGSMTVRNATPAVMRVLEIVDPTKSIAVHRASAESDSQTSSV